MKKITSIILALLLALSIAPITAFAENGPKNNDYGLFFTFIRFFDNSGEAFYNVFSNNTVDNNALEGASYDLESNTLTLTDLNRPELSLSTNMMGDDFKLRIIGDCALDVVYIWGDMYGGSLDIEGDGVLTVNEAQKSDYALVMNAEGSNAKLNFGSDVKVNLYGQKAPCVISYSSYGDLETGITFENGENIPFKAGKESSIENDIVNTIEYEDLGSTWTTRYGILFNCDTETDEDVFYAGFYYDEDYYSGQALYTISRYKFLKKYDAIVKDQSFGGYGQLSVPADELEDSGYSVVTEKAKVQQLYTNDYMEKYSRGLEADRLIKDSDPDSIYCVNYSWTIDREHPDGYYIRRLIWDEDIEFYVPDPDFGDIFGSESYNADEFPDSGYSYLLDDDGDRVTVRYLDEYTGIDHYGEEAPLVLNDKTPGVKYIAELYTNYETGEETYLVTPIVYNEKRGYYFEGDNGEWLTPEEFDNSDYYFIYEDQPVKCVVKHNGDVTLSNLKLYQDSNGAQFGVDNHDLVYNIDYDKSEEIFGKTYYFYTSNDSVDVSKLTALTHEEVYNYYHYELEGTELHYNAGSEPAYILGDVDENGIVSISDATMIQYYLADLLSTPLTENQRKAADYNKNGNISIQDATLIQYMLADLI